MNRARRRLLTLRGKLRLLVFDACLRLLRVRPPHGCRFVVYAMPSGTLRVSTEGELAGHGHSGCERTQAVRQVQHQASAALAEGKAERATNPELDY